MSRWRRWEEVVRGEQALAWEYQAAWGLGASTALDQAALAMCGLRRRAEESDEQLRQRMKAVLGQPIPEWKRTSRIECESGLPPGTVTAPGDVGWTGQTTIPPSDVNGQIKITASADITEAMDKMRQVVDQLKGMGVRRAITLPAVPQEIELNIQIAPDPEMQRTIDDKTTDPYLLLIGAHGVWAVDEAIDSCPPGRSVYTFVRDILDGLPHPDSITFTHMQVRDRTYARHRVCCYGVLCPGYDDAHPRYEWRRTR